MKYFIGLLFLVLMIIIAVLMAQFIFEKKVKVEITELFKGIKVRKSDLLTKKDVINLPPIVQKWLKNSHVIDREKIRTVRLKQTGLLRTTPQQAWIPFKAEQYVNVERPGFIWFADVKAGPFIHLAGRDKYYDGQGNMLIKLMSLFKVVDAVGMEIDQGSLIRYLAEIMWYPAAATNDYIKWETIDSRSVRATMTYHGVTGSGVFLFNEDGNPVSFSAKRYLDQGGKNSLEDWQGRVSDYREFNGTVIPAKGEIIWKLPKGDFNWFQFEVKEIEYNKPVIY